MSFQCTRCSVMSMHLDSKAPCRSLLHVQTRGEWLACFHVLLHVNDPPSVVLFCKGC